MRNPGTMALQITAFNECCPLYNILLHLCIGTWVWTEWEDIQVSLKCGNSSKLEILWASSPNLHLRKQSPLGPAGSIFWICWQSSCLYLLYISNCELELGQKAGRETWYLVDGLTPAVGDTLTSRVTAFSSPTIHQEDVYTFRYVGSKDVKFCSENTF